MSSERDEIERVKRLREQQIRTRNPYKKNDRTQQRISQKVKTQKKYTWGDAIRDMPAKFTYLIVGGLIGLVFSGTIALIIEAPWEAYMIVGFVLFGMMGGFLVGNYVDWARYG